MSAHHTVKTLIEHLKHFPEDLPVIFRIHDEAGENTFDPICTFIPKDAGFSMKGGKPTYLGDIDVVRVDFKQDEP